MLNSTTFRVLHWTATVIMAVTIAMYCYLQHIQRLTVRDKLYEVRQLTPRTWLYITEYAAPDMTTGDVYRYFLASKFDGDPLEGLEKQHIAPTLTANTPRAKVDGIGNNISFTVHGTVYDFTTSAFFYDAEGIAVVPSVDLTARGEGWDKGKFNQ